MAASLRPMINMAALLLVALASCAVLMAQAQDCPTTVCNSYFANAMGGPIDCCQYNYSGPGSRCQWGGTPVSFTLVGTCSADGQTYTTLLPSNFQGPPGQPNCRCQEAEAGGGGEGAGGTPEPVSGYTARPDTDVPGKDLPSDGLGYTKVCGPPADVAARCAQGHKGGNCVGFAYEQAAQCGYIKYSAEGAVARPGYTTYVQA